MVSNTATAAGRIETVHQRSNGVVPAKPPLAESEWRKPKSAEPKIAEAKLVEMPEQDGSKPVVE